MDNDFGIPMGDEDNAFTIITKLFDNANIRKISDLNDTQISEMVKLYFFTLIEEDQYTATQIIRMVLDYFCELSISRSRMGRTEIKEIMKSVMSDLLDKNEDKSLIGGLK